ncbi:hypothetical protein MNBD_NITROSPIRAE01-1188 [hydrothermal vent metagenome]|uniref:Cell division protein FtsL n=1 Tax=hydrothermal vent metagenome TaxID=652676 RepID=A0A3B1C6N8_9ZZZZ
MNKLTTALILIIPIVIVSFLSVWQRNDMIKIGYKTEILQKEKHALLRHRKELRVHVERLSALDRIEQIALNELGMKHAEPEQRVYITAQALETRFNED